MYTQNWIHRWDVQVSRHVKDLTCNRDELGRETMSSYV